MSGKHIGYVRVSSVDQNTARQLEGVELHKSFEDKASGKDTKRPQLQACLDYLRDGDTLHVHSMDRLARNLVDLLAMVKGLTGRGVTIEFHKERLTFTGDPNPMQDLQLAVMGAVAEFERAMIRERQREGIDAAQKRGVRFGRERKLSDEQAAAMIARAHAGEQKAALAKEFGISRETLYQHLRAAGDHS